MDFQQVTCLQYLSHVNVFNSLNVGSCCVTPMSQIVGRDITALRPPIVNEFVAIHVKKYCFQRA